MKTVGACLALLVALLADHPQTQADRAPSEAVWPIDFSDFMGQKITTKDLNGDGVAETVITGYDGGSGYRFWGACYRDGKTSQVACESTMATSYSSFFGSEVDAPSKSGKVNQAADLVSSTCANKLETTDKGQAAMWLLSKKKSAKLRWLSGKPWVQTRACMDLSTAKKFLGALAWFSDEGSPSDSWTVIYSPTAVQLPFETRSKDAHKPLQPIYDAGRFQIYQHGHALAIYWPRRDQHAWFFNAESLVDGDFKFDRFNSIDSVLSKGGRIRIKLAERLGPDKTIRLGSLRP